MRCSFRFRQSPSGRRWRTPAGGALCTGPAAGRGRAGDGPAGRLKVRIDSHTITYHGALRIAAQDDGFIIEGEGSEVRGSGAVKLSLTLRLTESAAGTTLTFTGTAHGEGLLTELRPEAVLAAAHRLLDRIGGPGGGRGRRCGPRETRRRTRAGGRRWGTRWGKRPHRRAFGRGDAVALTRRRVRGTSSSSTEHHPAEAAHARRTMIGRSAEEVDHAPPRGRYAPVPAPDDRTAGGRCAGWRPAAALALASAVVVGRVLRRRRS